MKRIIANRQVLDHGELVKRDILIEDDKVAGYPKISTDGVDDVIDAKGSFVSAGLIDVHVHYRQQRRRKRLRPVVKQRLMMDLPPFVQCPMLPERQTRLII